MINNNFLSFERFALLLKKDFMENWKTMFLRFVMLYAILAIIFGFIGHWEYRLLNNNPSYFSHDNMNYITPAIFLFWGVGCLFASLMMEKMRSKTKRISYLMTPATSFEKYFSRLLIVVVVFIASYLVAFKLADYTRIAIFSICYPKLNISSIDLLNLVDTKGYGGLAHTWGQFIGGFSIYLFFQSLFILGSILWYKNPFIKTIASGVVIVLIFTLIDGVLIHYLFPNDLKNLFSVSNYCEDIVNRWCTWRNTTILFSIFTLFNWTIAYFRFKDSEIINRI